MNKIQVSKSPGQESPFVKGMTLEQYMSQAQFQKEEIDQL